jgi:hypothetical protein
MFHYSQAKVQDDQRMMHHNFNVLTVRFTMHENVVRVVHEVADSEGECKVRQWFESIDNVLVQGRKVQYRVKTNGTGNRGMNQ